MSTGRCVCRCSLSNPCRPACRSWPATLGTPRREGPRLIPCTCRPPHRQRSQPPGPLRRRCGTRAACELRETGTAGPALSNKCGLLVPTRLNGTSLSSKEQREKPRLHCRGFDGVTLRALFESSKSERERHDRPIWRRPCGRGAARRAKAAAGSRRGGSPRQALAAAGRTVIGNGLLGSLQQLVIHVSFIRRKK